MGQALGVKFPVIEYFESWTSDSVTMVDRSRIYGKTSHDRSTFTYASRQSNSGFAYPSTQYRTDNISYVFPANTINHRITGYTLYADGGANMGSALLNSNETGVDCMCRASNAVMAQYNFSGTTAYTYWGVRFNTSSAVDTSSGGMVAAPGTSIVSAPVLNHPYYITLCIAAKNRNSTTSAMQGRIYACYLSVDFAWDDAPIDQGESHIGPLGSSVPYPVGSLYVGGVQVKKIVSADAAKTGVPVGTVLYRLPGVPP